jgi:hypothetical protein
VAAGLLQMTAGAAACSMEVCGQVRFWTTCPRWSSGKAALTRFPAPGPPADYSSYLFNGPPDATLLPTMCSTERINEDDPHAATTVPPSPVRSSSLLLPLLLIDELNL